MTRRHRRPGVNDHNNNVASPHLDNKIFFLLFSSEMERISQAFYIDELIKENKRQNYNEDGGSSKRDQDTECRHGGVLSISKLSHFNWEPRQETKYIRSYILYFFFNKYL